MSPHHERHRVAGQETSDRRARAKLEDKKRMAWRRAVEFYNETRRLQRELNDYPDLAIGEPSATGQHRSVERRETSRV
ncbi:transcriptional regulator [Pseudomonas sp. RIT-PI-AD]|uniref:PA3496 family putative envelope integrity protein n=1 Tax=Pseudomonas sp. RIT-PI-AD TaxID=3035294 RepID=UPI0021D95ECE|nr:transcriptional regulator [Pseudomonas sp. RIT-PI-AD]